MDVTPAIIEQIMKLMTQNMVDQVAVGDLTITKTQHIMPEMEEKSSDVDEDDLFYSVT